MGGGWLAPIEWRVVHCMSLGHGISPTELTVILVVHAIKAAARLQAASVVELVIVRVGGEGCIADRAKVVERAEVSWRADVVTC
jgi:hypothetical protein